MIGKKKKVAIAEIITTSRGRPGALKKRITERERQLYFQGKVLQKLVELLDGITIHPVKGVILTPNKKRQLAELRKMEQKLFKPKIKKPRE